MSEATNNTGAVTEQMTITESDLRKSLEALEGIKTEENKKPAEPTIKTETLAKTANESVAATASTDLKKALDVSMALREFTNLIGIHVDSSLETLQKSIHEGAVRDHKMITVLSDLKKSLDANTAAIEKFGQAPATTPQTKTSRDQVMEKSTSSQATSERKAPTKGQILQVLTKKATSADLTDGERNRYIQAAAKLESAGAIDDAMLLEVAQELKKA
jgi:hypothetical protein